MLEEDIEVVQDKIDDPVLCQKVEQYAKAPFEIQEMFRKDAGKHSLFLACSTLSPGPLMINF